jgi:hypothetical protein
MNLKKQALGLALAVITAALTITVSIVSSHNIPGKQSPALSGENERTIIGAWRVALTSVNCQTGDVVRTIPGLWTFHEGGTMSEFSSAPGLSPAVRGSGHGVWQREPGWQDYSATFIFYRYDAIGVFTGSQTGKIALKIGANGDEFTATSEIQVFDANGNVVFTGCGTPTGTRFGSD